MSVYDGPFGIVECEVMTMDTSREVYILRVHEIPLIKEPCLHRRFRTQQHETAAEVWCIDRPREVEIAQLIAFVPPRHQPRRQEPTTEDIYR